MQLIADLLKNHKIPGAAEREQRQVCASAAESLFSHPISARQVALKDGKLTFRVPSVLKSEILLRAEDLKAILKGAGVVVVSIH